MSLVIDGSKIVIQNANSVEKFNSDQRLVYQTGYASGSSSLTSTVSHRVADHGLSINLDNDIVTMYVTITSATGSVGASLVGLRIPAQSTIPIDVYARNLNNYAAVDSTYMIAYNNHEKVFFNAVWCDYVQEFPSTMIPPEATNHNIYFTWEIFSYRYVS